MGRIRQLQPPQWIAISFLSAILLGAACLKLPGASRGRLSTVDAVFTATSAVCVTGLITKDTGRDFTPFGQAIILLLIQAGGLGIMTFSTFLLLVLRQRSSVASRDAAAPIAGPVELTGRVGLGQLLRRILLFVAGAETVGALLLFAPIAAREESTLRAAWSAVFHAVSAFCNAGFSLYDDSICAYRSSIYTVVVFSGLIVAGGLGFPVICELIDLAKGKLTGHRLSFHSRLVITATIVLLVGGTLAILVCERDGILRKESTGERVLSAFFLSVTARTAGFNTVPTAKLAAPTLFFVIMLMFIGASPCSTGGGTKTTTLAALVIAGYSRLRGRANASAFGRTIPPEGVSRAIAVIVISVGLIVLMTLVLLNTETEFGGRLPFLSVLFEAGSAYGTVGLSMGITPSLSPVGKLLVALLMFAGRVGPLSLAVAMVGKVTAPPLAYPEEEVIIG